MKPVLRSTLLLSAPLALAVPLSATGQNAVPAQSLTAAPGEITLSPRDQPIGAFLKDLFGRVGRPVIPSGSLTGTVNGVFRGTVNKIYADIARAFNLVSYDDGAALYVYSANELSVQTLNVGRATAQRVTRQVSAMRLADRRNYVRTASDGNLVVSGTPRFVQQVTAMAQGGSGSGVAGGGGGAAPGFGGGLAPAPLVSPLEFRVFYLRYARAEDTLTVAGGREVRLPGLASILQNLVLDQRPGGSAPPAGTVQFGARPVRQSQPRLRGSGLDAIPPSGSQVPSLGLPTPGYYPGQSDVLGYGGGETMAPLTSDVVRIEANPYLNAVVVRDVPERMGAYDSLIRALDVEPQVVEIEATIIDINTDRLRRLGINWRLSTGGFGALFGNGTDSDLALSRDRTISRRDNVDRITPRGEGGTISTIIGSQRQFLARITALENKGVARVVSKPQILTLANVEAVFDRTRTFYVRVAGREEVDLFNVTAGTVLRVNPHVFRDQDQTRVRMMINIEDGSLTPNDIENIPIVERSSVATQAMVLDGESLLLGGMTVDADIDDVTKVPFLGDIPLLGNLFKFQEKRRSRTERLFLITPRLVSLGSRVGPTTVGPAAVPAAQPGAPTPSLPASVDTTGDTSRSPNR